MDFVAPKKHIAPRKNFLFFWLRRSGKQNHRFPVPPFSSSIPMETHHRDYGRYWIELLDPTRITGLLSEGRRTYPSLVISLSVRSKQYKKKEDINTILQTCYFYALQGSSTWHHSHMHTTFVPSSSTPSRIFQRRKAAS